MDNMSSKDKVRVRLAPSPTGFLHIGNLRTALFNYLIAKKYGGVFLLRIEDTDQKRQVEGAAEKLVKILDWCGLKFDEGPGLGGSFGPYVQSERLEVYQKYAEELLKSEKAYLCFCSPERLEEMKAEQARRKLPPRYDRLCRDLSESEVEAKIRAGEPFVVRQKIPLEGEIAVTDEIRGEIRFRLENLEDHVLLKTDGWPTYQLAAVVDDHLMEISHVVRGDEWISSFPKNILLYQAFGWMPPKFVHIPLTLNKEGGKLSKRQGDVAVEDYRAKGYLPEALINFCALLGWHPKDDNEILSLDEIIQKFEIKDIGDSPAIFDIDKLDYFNGWYIRQKPTSELAKLCRPYFENKLGADDLRLKDEEFLHGVVLLAQERMKKLSEVYELSEFFFAEPTYEPGLLIWKKLTAGEVKNNLEEVHKLLDKVPPGEWTKHSTRDAIMTHLESKDLKTGDYLWPLRVALTGRQASPGPFEVAGVMGKIESLKRIKKAVEKLL